MTSLTRRVIVDADFGIDDAFALLILLFAERLGKVKIEGIVCTMGNAQVDDVCTNAVRLLETFNRTDIPVFKGASEALVSGNDLEKYYGKDGFGDLQHENQPNMEIIQKELAPIGIHRIVSQNPGEISIIGIGPLTNIALTMKLFNDFSKDVKEILILGGNHPDVSGTAEVEYNFRVDPESAYVVFKNAACPITIVPWETCSDTYISLDWRYKVLGKKQSPFMDLLNRAEKNLQQEPVTGDSIWYPYDTYIVTCALFPKECILKQNKYNVIIDLSNDKTKGQIILNESKDKEWNTTIIEKINDEFIKDILLKAATL